MLSYPTFIHNEFVNIIPEVVIQMETTTTTMTETNEKDVQPGKKKTGRPSGVEMMDYGKNIIRDANMRRRNEEGQEIMYKLVDIFWDKYKKYPGTLFWLPFSTESNTNTHLAFLPEEKYSRSYLPCNVYRLSEVRHPKNYNGNKLRADLVFERVLFPEGYSYPPRVSYPIVEIVRRMLLTSHDANAYFLDPKAYKEFISEASRLSNKYSNNCEPKRLISAGCSWIKKNIKDHPERYTYNKDNNGFLRYRRMFLESAIRSLQNDVYRLQHEVARLTEPGNLGYVSREEAENQLKLRIEKINKMLSERALQRSIERYPKGYVNEKELRKSGVTITAQDFEYLPPQVQAEYQWMCIQFKILRNYNVKTLQLAAAQKKLKAGEKALAYVKSLATNGINDPDGLGETIKYWEWYKKRLEDQRKANISAPESIDEPMVLKNAALLMAGELRARETRADETISPIFSIEQDREI